MKRRVLTVAVFMLAGAVVNVAVAWGCIAWMPATFVESIEGTAWPRSVPQWWGPSAPVRSGGWVWAGLGWDAREVWVYGHDWNSTAGVWRAGWPFRSLTGYELESVYQLETRYDSSGLWEISSDPETDSLLIGVSWPGLLTNTLLYGFAIWLVTVGPFALRRLIRHRRGLCAACGYDLRHGEHEACPECGVAA